MHDKFKLPFEPHKSYHIIEFKYLHQQFKQYIETVIKDAYYRVLALTEKALSDYIDLYGGDKIVSFINRDEDNCLNKFRRLDKYIHKIDYLFRLQVFYGIKDLFNEFYEYICVNEIELYKPVVIPPPIQQLAKTDDDEEDENSNNNEKEEEEERNNEGNNNEEENEEDENKETNQLETQQELQPNNHNNNRISELSSKITEQTSINSQIPKPEWKHFNELQKQIIEIFIDKEQYNKNNNNNETINLEERIVGKLEKYETFFTEHNYTPITPPSRFPEITIPHDYDQSKYKHLYYKTKEENIDYSKSPFISILYRPESILSKLSINNNNKQQNQQQQYHEIIIDPDYTNWIYEIRDWLKTFYEFGKVVDTICHEQNILDLLSRYLTVINRNIFGEGIISLTQRLIDDEEIQLKVSIIKDTLNCEEEIINQTLKDSQYIFTYFQQDENIKNQSFEIIDHNIPSTSIFENSFLLYIKRLFDLFLKAIPLSIGCTLIDYSPVIRRILPSISHHLHELRNKLPCLLLNYISDLDKYIESYENILNKVPNTLEESEIWMKTLIAFDRSSIKDGGKLYYDLNDKIDNTSILTTLLKNVDVPLPDDIDAVVTMLKDHQSNYYSLVDKCVRARDEHLKIFRYYLNTAVEELGGVCNTHYDNLKNNLYWIDKDLAPEPIIELLSKTVVECHEMEKKMLYYQSLDDLFENISLQKLYTKMEETIELGDNLLSLFTLLKDFNDFKTKNIHKNINDFDITSFSDCINKFTETIEKITIKQHPVYKKLYTELKQFKYTLPLIKELSTSCLEERHWKQILEYLKLTQLKPPYRVETFSEIQDEIDINKIKATVKLAIIEDQIKSKLDSVWKFWQTEDVTFYYEDNVAFISPYENEWKLEHDTVSLESILNVNNLWINDTRSLIMSLRYLSQIFPALYSLQDVMIFFLQVFQAEQFITSFPTLTHMWDDIKMEWGVIIKMFKESRSIYHLSFNISILPHLNEQKQRCDNLYVHLDEYMNKLRILFPRFCYLSDNDLYRLLSWNGSIERVSDTLLCCYPSIRHIEYLAKRNGILIQITDGKDENGKEVRKDKNTELSIISLTTHEAFHFTFDKPIEVSDEIEKWSVLFDKSIHDQLKTTLDKNIKIPCLIYSTDDFLSIPPQIRMICQSTQWFQQVEELMIDRLSPRGEKKWLDFIGIQKLDKERVIFFLLHNLLPIPRYVAECYLLQLTNEENNIKMIVDNEIFNSNDYRFMTLLKYRYSHTNDCYLTMFTTNIKYGYEICTLCPRLIITPLTEKVIFTIFESIKYEMGCTLLGQRNFGRRHYIYSLSQMCGRLFIDYSCDQWKMKDSIQCVLNGNIATGAWCLFHNLTALSFECQSYLLAQMQIMRLIYNRKNYNLSYSAFTSINPEMKSTMFCTVDISKEENIYNKLIKDVSTLFRPITYLKPDKTYIINKAFKNAGFNGDLAPSFVNEIFETIEIKSMNITTQKLFSVALIFQIIENAIMKLPLPQIPPNGISNKEEWVNIEYYSDSEELSAVIQTIDELTFSRIPKEDTIIIQTVSFIYEEKYLNTKHNEDEEDMPDPIRLGYSTIIVNNNYRNIEQEFTAISQLYNNMSYSHFIIISGKPCSGKSFCINSLCDICNLLHNANSTSNAHYYPKIVLKKLPVILKTPSIIIGQASKGITKYSGYLMNIFESYTVSEAELHSKSSDNVWVVIDGLLDNNALDFIKSINMGGNTVLPTGDHVTIPSYINLIIELPTLENISPSVLTSYGCVAIQDFEFTWEVMWYKWKDNMLKKNTIEYRKEFIEYIDELISEQIPTLVDFTKQCTRSTIYTSHNQMDILLFQTTVLIIDSYWMKLMEYIDVLKKQDEEIYPPPFHEYYYILFILYLFIYREFEQFIRNLVWYATLWSFYSGFDSLTKSMFVDYMKNNFIAIKLPQRCDSIFQIYLTDQFTFVSLPTTYTHQYSEDMSELLSTTDNNNNTMKITATSEIFQQYAIMCPLPEISNLTTVMSTIMNIQRIPYSLLLSGDIGSGKSTVFRLLYTKYFCSHSQVSITPTTTIYNIIETIKSSSFQLKDKQVAWDNSKVHILIDDLNYHYNTSPLKTNIEDDFSEFLRHLIQYNMIVDYESLQLLTLQDITISYTINNYYLDKLSRRLFHHFRHFEIPNPSYQSLTTIFEKYIQTLFIPPLEIDDIVVLYKKLASVSCNYYLHCKAKIHPNIILPHISIDLYKFYTLLLKMFQYNLNNSDLDTRDITQLWYNEIDRIYFDPVSNNTTVRYQFYQILRDEFKAVFKQRLENNFFHNLMYTDILDLSVQKAFSDANMKFPINTSSTIGIDCQRPVVCNEVCYSLQPSSTSTPKWAAKSAKRTSIMMKRSSLTERMEKAEKRKKDQGQSQQKSIIVNKISDKTKKDNENYYPNIKDFGLGFVVDMKIKLKKKRFAIKNEINMIRSDIPDQFKLFRQRKFQVINYLGFVDNDFIQIFVNLFNHYSIDNISGSLNHDDFVNSLKLLNYIRIHVPTVLICHSYDRAQNIMKLCGFLDGYQTLEVRTASELENQIHKSIIKETPFFLYVTTTCLLNDPELLWLCNAILSGDENINIIKPNNLNSIIQYERNILTESGSKNKLYKSNKFIYNIPWKTLYNNYLNKTYNYLYLTVCVESTSEYKLYIYYYFIL